MHSATSRDITVDSWVRFAVFFIADEKSLGHAVLRIRVDRVPNLTTHTIRPNENGTVTLHMAHHIEQAVKQFCPGLLDGSDKPSKRMPKGSSAMTLTDGLYVDPVVDEKRRLHVQRLWRARCDSRSDARRWQPSRCTACRRSRTPRRRRRHSWAT